MHFWKAVFRLTVPHCVLLASPRAATGWCQSAAGFVSLSTYSLRSAAALWRRALTPVRGGVLMAGQCSRRMRLQSPGLALIASWQQDVDAARTGTCCEALRGLHWSNARALGTAPRVLTSLSRLTPAAAWRIAVC